MCSEIKNEGNRMLLVKCFNNYSPLAESTETISRFDIVACFFVVISHRKYTKWFYFKKKYYQIFASNLLQYEIKVCFSFLTE